MLSSTNFNIQLHWLLIKRVEIACVIFVSYFWNDGGLALSHLLPFNTFKKGVYLYFFHTKAITLITTESASKEIRELASEFTFQLNHGQLR